MELKDFVIGLLFFIALTIVTLSFVIDMYSSNGFNIDLNADNKTKFLGDLNDRAIASQLKADGTSKAIWNRTIGQMGANIESGSTTEADMIKTSLFSLTSIGDYLDIFNSLLVSGFNAIGIPIDQNSILANPVFWFISLSVIITIGFILLSTVIRTGL